VWHRPPPSISSTTANRSSYNVRLNLTFAALVVTFLTTVKRPSHPKESSFALYRYVDVRLHPMAKIIPGMLICPAR
jgi:hypothetical protein